jgi:spore coat protein CotH
MDKFAKGQVFHGLDKFHLANSVQDPSYLSELICGELFRAAGVPASRVCHAVVTINGRRRGLYYVKEGYDKFFRKRHFENPRGNLYDGGFLRDLDQPLQLLSGKEDVKNHADLKALVAAARERDPQQRYQKMERLLDMDRFVTYLALEVITWDWDGYPMNRNNYRIYHEPKRDKIIFIPSGMDQMFGDPNGPALPGFQGFVARALVETPQGRERYFARMAEILNTVYRPDALVKRLDALQAQVQPVLASIDAGAGRGYPAQVNRLRQAIRQRAVSLEGQLRRLKK